MRRASRVFDGVALVAAAVVLAAPDPAGAQGSPTGTLSGTVTDPSGSVLPGVTVIARGAQNGLTQQTVSGGAGDWRIPALP
jgi:2-methylaconitate cis-trans-isomerase PrpF